MRKALRHFFLASFIASGSLLADLQQEDLGSENINSETEDQKAFTVQANYDWIGKAKLHKNACHGNIEFATGVAEASMVFYYNPCYQEGLSAGLEYSNTKMIWKRNPYFHNQKYWNTISPSINGFTKRAEGWLWLGQAQMNFDVNHWNFDDYTTYDFLLWGRYDYCENIGVNIGFILETGMKIDHMYPIIGVDWQYNEDIKLNFVFPVNISAVYAINSNWSADVAVRYFDTRHRAGPKEPVPRSLFYYHSTGFEGGLTYTDCSWLSLNVHAGYNAGGVLRLGNKEWKEKRNVDFDGAPYFGGEAKIHF